MRIEGGGGKRGVCRVRLKRRPAGIKFATCCWSKLQVGRRSSLAISLMQGPRQRGRPPTDRNQRLLIHGPRDFPSLSTPQPPIGRHTKPLLFTENKASHNLDIFPSRI